MDIRGPRPAPATAAIAEHQPLGRTGQSVDDAGMPDRTYSESERLRFYRCMTRIFQMERELGGTMIDAIILRAAAIGRLEGRPMSVSALASYVNLPRQTVSRRVERLARRGLMTTRREGNRTLVETTEKAKRNSLTFANDAIDETVAFVREIDKARGGPGAAGRPEPGS